MNFRQHAPHFRRPALVLSLIFALLATASTRAADPHHLQSVIAQLGSDDPRLRQSALDELMKIKAPDLAKIRDAAISQGPLLPGQVAALREAVTQIYLAAQRYPVDPDYYGFIGLRWSPELAHSTPVVVDERIPGFPAYEFLQPGDVILQFTDWPAVQLRVPDDFILIARRLSAGDPLRLTVRRDGRPIVITMKFDYFPGEVTPTNIDAWIQDRARKAEAYWNSEFSAVDPAAAPMATQASTSVQP